MLVCFKGALPSLKAFSLSYNCKRTCGCTIGLFARAVLASEITLKKSVVKVNG